MKKFINKAWNHCVLCLETKKRIKKGSFMFILTAEEVRKYLPTILLVVGQKRKLYKLDYDYIYTAYYLYIGKHDVVLSPAYKDKKSKYFHLSPYFFNCGENDICISDCVSQKLCDYITCVTSDLEKNSNKVLVLSLKEG